MSIVLAAFLVAIVVNHWSKPPKIQSLDKGEKTTSFVNLGEQNFILAMKENYSGQLFQGVSPEKFFQIKAYIVTSDKNVNNYEFRRKSLPIIPCDQLKLDLSEYYLEMQSLENRKCVSVSS